MKEDPVKDDRGKQGIPEHFAPLGEALVGGQDHSASQLSQRVFL